MVSAIVLFTIPVFANALVGFMGFIYFAPLIVLAFIPVVAIESYVLLKALRLTAGRSVKVSAITNAVSALVGIALAIALELLVPLSGRGAPETLIAVTMMAFMLVPFFLASWGIEYFVARFLFRNEPPPQGLSKAEFKANLASYVFLLMVIAVVAFVESRQGEYAMSQNAAVGTMRTINTAEITYASTFDSGYSATLSYLGPSAGKPGSTAAGLIPSDLAWSGTHYGYRFIYSSGPPDETGKINAYTVSARPLKYGKTGRASYFTDQTGVIRQTTEDRPATVKDLPTAGG